jgi:hypothetical protein
MCALQDLLKDTSNCGACGTVCPSDAFCKLGSCACPKGMEPCGDKCVKEGDCPPPPLPPCVNGTTDCGGSCKVSCQEVGGATVHDCSAHRAHCNYGMALETVSRGLHLMISAPT